MTTTHKKTSIPCTKESTGTPRGDLPSKKVRRRSDLPSKKVNMTLFALAQP